MNKEAANNWKEEWLKTAKTEWIFIQYEASTISHYKALSEGHIQEAKEHKSDMDICKAELMARMATE